MRRASSSATRPLLRAAVLGATVLVAALLVVPIGAALASSDPSAAPSAARLVSYKSSVDSFPLSYLEWLPAGFTSKHAFPLVVFLHGLGTSTNAVKGGTGGSSVTPEIISNASAFGAILISVNTRSSAGFYADTACGGPQKQDLLDALAAETKLRNVSGVYLIGFSMGTIGALEVAAEHSSTVSGVALIAPITDVFEVSAYGLATHTLPSALRTDLCGKFPGPRAPALNALFVSMSPARFAPTNFSRVPIYVTAGALDTKAPNNASIWPYAQVNSTFVNSTCQTATALGEPANCTTTLWSLAKAHPGQFEFRYVWEPKAFHSILQANTADLFGYLLGHLSNGFLAGSFPPGVLVGLPPPP